MSTAVNKLNITDNGTKIWNPVYTRVFCTNALLFLGMQMVNTLVAKYADYLGATATIVGLVSSLFALTALIFKVVSGPAIDSFNRKNILVAAIFVITISFFGFSISNNIEMLFVFRLLQGCGQAFTATCCLALAADSLPADKFGTGIGTFTLAQAACQAIGPTVGLTLAQYIGYKPTFAIAACCTMCGVLMAATIRTPVKIAKKFKISIKNIAAREAMLPAVLLFFLQMTFGNINSFLVIFANNKGVMNIGLFFTVYAITMLFAPVTIGRLSDRWGITRAILPAMGLFAVSFLIISVSGTLPMFLLAAVTAAFGYGAAQPAVQTLCMKCVPESRRGAASSTSYIGQDLGNLAGPIIAGMIAERAGYVVMWRAMVIPIAVSVILVMIFSRKISSIEIAFKSRQVSQKA